MRRWSLVLVSMVLVLAASAAMTRAMPFSGPSQEATIRTLPVGPTSVPITAEAVAVDPHGHVYFLDDAGAVREVVP